MMNAARQVYCGPPGIRLRQLTGPRMEEDLPAFFEDQQALYVHKGRTAIRLACDLLRLGPGSEILAPSYNCGSEIDALLSSGASVSLYRITRSASIDLDDLEQRITQRTEAVYVTHYFGFPHDLSEVMSLCRRANLYLIEDCALSLFSLHHGGMIGTEGDISIFSLPKTLPVPDGGILMVNHDGIVKGPIGLLKPDPRETFVNALPWLKSAFLRWSGVRAPMTTRHPVRLPAGEEICARPEMPSNYYYDDDYTGKGMSLLSQRLSQRFIPEAIRTSRRRNFEMLSAAIDRCPGVQLLFRDLPEGTCPLVLPVLVEKRDELTAGLKDRSIDARAWWRGFHRGLPWNEFPDACYLKDRLLALPVHQDLSDDDIAYVASSFRDLVTA